MIELINNVAAQWMNAAIKASLQGGIVLAAVWGICRYVPRISPSFKMWLWRLAWIKFLLAFFWIGEIELPLLSAPTRMAQPSGSGWLDTGSFPASIPAHSATIVGHPSLKPRAILFLLWAIGVLVCVTGLAWQCYSCARLRRDVSRITNPSLAELCSRFQIRNVPELRESTAVSSPMLVGILRPAIILPSGQISSDRLKLMLAHELAHLKRRDLFWGWLPAICHSLFFFHPLLWLSRREWLLAQEIACDELAVRHSTASPVLYGNMLVDLVAANVPRASFGALGISETSKNLKRRILAMKHIATPNSRLLMAALLTVIIVASVPLRIVGQEQPDDPATRLKQLERENAKLRAELDRLRAAPATRNDASAVRTLETARVADQLAMEINAAEVELAALRTRYSDEHPKVREAQTRLKKMKELQVAEKWGAPSTKKKHPANVTSTWKNWNWRSNTSLQ